MVSVSGRYIAVVGDRSSHGGVILTGDPIATVNGIPVARIGDLHACPRYWGDTPHGVRPVISVGCSSTRGLSKGRPHMLRGDKATCGATILPKQRLGASKC